MRYLDLQNRYSAIQEGKKRFLKDEVFYIKNALKANGDLEDTRLEVIQLDRLEQDYPDCVMVSGFPMRIKKIYLKDDDIKFIGVCDGEYKGKTHHLFLDTDNVEHVENAARFVNRILTLQGETNMYSLLVVYTQDNPLKINPVVLDGKSDEEVWTEIQKLSNNHRRVYQMKGRLQKFPNFAEFIQDFNEGSFWKYYAINIMLKEKHL